MTSDNEDLLISTEHHVGTITLNRPQRINALTRSMVDAMYQQLTAWARDGHIHEVVLQGAGERGFCAGADVRVLRDQMLAGDEEQVLEYLYAEYQLVGLIAAYPKRVRAHLDGVTMGAGLGIGLHDTYRTGNAASKLAMPEVAIGIWPDVGVCFELSRIPRQIGTHLAMTGNALDATSAMWIAWLYEGPEGSPKQSWLAKAARWMDECYVGDDPVQIVNRLAGHVDPDARAAAETIRSRCPMSVAVALAAVRRAAQLPDVRAVLAQDRTLARTMLADPHDFVEGVRAKMVDRDEPKWRHARLEDVDPDEVRARFVSR